MNESLHKLPNWSELNINNWCCNFSSFIKQTEQAAKIFLILHICSSSPEYQIPRLIISRIEKSWLSSGGIFWLICNIMLDYIQLNTISSYLRDRAEKPVPKSEKRKRLPAEAVMQCKWPILSMPLKGWGKNTLLTILQNGTQTSGKSKRVAVILSFWSRRY